MVRPLRWMLRLPRIRAMLQSCIYWNTTTQSCQSAHPHTVSPPLPPLHPHCWSFYLWNDIFAFKQPMEKNILYFAQLFTVHWFRHNCRIYILLSVVFKTDTNIHTHTHAHIHVHIDDRHPSQKTTFELHPPQGNDACLGSGRVTVEDNDVQENYR